MLAAPGFFASRWLHSAARSPCRRSHRSWPARGPWKRLGITFEAPPQSQPSLYMHGDGEYADAEYPDGWRELINAEADRIGWTSPYRPETARKDH